MSRKVWEFLGRHHALWLAMVIVFAEKSYTGGC
jgi:hypothetical protein